MLVLAISMAVFQANRLIQYKKRVEKLNELLPICANCKKIRDDEGYWNNVEDYFRDQGTADFTHGICPECSKKLYGDYL